MESVYNIFWCRRKLHIFLRQSTQLLPHGDLLFYNNYNNNCNSYMYIKRAFYLCNKCGGKEGKEDDK